MSRARVIVAFLGLGLSLLQLGCGPATDDPLTIFHDFKADQNAAKHKYKAKPARLKLDKVVSATKGDTVGVEGRIGKMIVSANVSDAAEMTKALALKVGGPATLEGEVYEAHSDVPGTGLIFLRSAKVVP